MKLAIIIPAYNEAKVIGRVIRSIPKKIKGVGQPTILVVDDGSTDGTARVARRAGARVLRHLLNRGKGAALSTGLQAARLLDASVIVTLDADGQHDPDEMGMLIMPIAERRADLVIGSRLLVRNGHMPFDRRLANKISNSLAFLLHGVKVTDSQSGYRAFSRKALERISVQSRGFEVETEVLAEARRKHLRITEIPIKTIYTPYSRSKGQRFGHGLVMAINLMLRALRGYR